MAESPSWGRPSESAALNLFKQLADTGVFAVPGGELEFWLKSLGATGHGPAWLINVFERMGEDPGDGANYLKPGNNDVWRFLSEVKTWLVNPARKGIAHDADAQPAVEPDSQTASLRSSACTPGNYISRLLKNSIYDAR